MSHSIHLKLPGILIAVPLTLSDTESSTDMKCGELTLRPLAAGMRPSSLQGRIYGEPLSEFDAIHVSFHLQLPNTPINKSFLYQ